MSTEVIVSIISTLGLVSVALISRWQIPKLIRRRRVRMAAATEETLAKHEQSDAALADYQNNPAAFVDRVLTDNAQKHEEIQQLKQDWQSDRDEFREAIAELRLEVRELRQQDAKFRGALSRWLQTVFLAWGKASAMPRPEGEDEIVLRPVLPWGHF